MQNYMNQQERLVGCSRLENYRPPFMTKIIAMNIHNVYTLQIFSCSSILFR